MIKIKVNYIETRQKFKTQFKTQLNPFFSYGGQNNLTKSRKLNIPLLNDYTRLRSILDQQHHRKRCLAIRYEDNYGNIFQIDAYFLISQLFRCTPKINVVF